MFIQNNTNGYSYCVACNVGEGYFVNDINYDESKENNLRFFDRYQNRICSGCPTDLGYTFTRINDNECLNSHGASSCDKIPNNIFKFHFKD